MKNDIDFLFKILRFIEKNKTETFSGIGAILYEEPLRLPVAALGDQSLFLPELPVFTYEKISQVLLSISDIRSPWHDGFHLINARTDALTHLSQFLAPPIELLDYSVSNRLPVGARRLAAMGVSHLESVVCSALLSSQGGIEIFVRGKQI